MELQIISYKTLGPYNTVNSRVVHVPATHRIGDDVPSPSEFDQRQRYDEEIAAIRRGLETGTIGWSSFDKPTRVARIGEFQTKYVSGPTYCDPDLIFHEQDSREQALQEGWKQFQAQHPRLEGLFIHDSVERFDEAALQRTVDYTVYSVNF